MAHDTHIYGEVDNKTDLRNVFLAIRKDASSLRETAEDEFATPARRINQRAKAIGADADYDETWGDN